MMEFKEKKEKRSLEDLLDYIICKVLLILMGVFLGYFWAWVALGGSLGAKV